MSSGDKRGDLQALRGVAVLLVLLFHLWPAAVPGGFIGVDVFFVISGYLITRGLLREVKSTGTVDIRYFYARRVKRLGPAAAVVLLAVAFLVPLLPEARWTETGIEIVTSALNVQNWHLANLSVDYLGAENAASPVQHFWSLSIEAQFYFMWPLLLTGVIWLFGPGTPALRFAILSVMTVSAAFSVYVTYFLDLESYFLTSTRVWELAVGAVIASARWSLDLHICRIFAWVGLGAIGIGAFTFSTITAFPGVAAFLPVIGAGLVIISGSSTYCHPFLNVGHLKRVGDTSYSLYLWHWPLIVFFSGSYSSSVEPIRGALILVASLGLAFLTYYYVEKVFYPGESKVREPSKWSFIASSALVGSALTAGTVVWSMTSAVAEIPISSADYPGAAAYLNSASSPSLAYLPTLSAVRSDLADVYRRGCHTKKHDKLVPCDYGYRFGQTHIIIFGDSHAASWVPALDAAANRRGWRVTSLTKPDCPPVQVPIALNGKPFLGCVTWVKAALAEIQRLRPTAVITTQASYHEAFGASDRRTSDQQLAKALTDTWRSIQQSGAKVLSIKDTPSLPFNPPECLSRDNECVASEHDVYPYHDIAIAAAASMPQVSVADFSAAFCRNAQCPSIIGNIVVWRDNDHFTGTFSRTLAVALEQYIIKTLDSRLVPTKP